MKTLQIYGDPTNRTICVRGDLDLTHWATISDGEEVDKEGCDVVALSDGTVIAFRFEGDDCRLSLLSTGPATLLPPGPENILVKGDIEWALVAFATEFARVPQ